MKKTKKFSIFFSEKNSNGRGAQGDLLQHNWEARSDISRIFFDRFTPLHTLECFSTVLSASSGYAYLIQIEIGKDFGKIVPNVDFRQNWELVAFDLRN